MKRQQRSFLACFFVCYFYAATTLFAQPPTHRKNTGKTAIPQPAAVIQKMSVWPPAVYIGEHFEARFVLSYTKYKMLTAGTLKRIGSAHIVGKPAFLKRDLQLIIKIPLAIYVVNTYGPIKLPHFSLTLRNPDGSAQKCWFPGPKIEIRSRYTTTQSFHLQQDPALPFLKKSKNKEPSHEWRMLPLTPKKSKGWPISWILGGVSIILAGVFWLFALFKKKPVEIPPILDHPYQDARERLSQLQQKRSESREELREQCNQMLQILRQYLHTRLSAPIRHLTAKELCQALEASPSEGLSSLQLALAPEHLSWHPLLQHILTQSEPLCFAPPASLQEPSETLSSLLQNTHQLLDAVEAWQKEKETKERLEQEQDDV